MFGDNCVGRGLYFRKYDGGKSSVKDATFGSFGLGGYNASEYVSAVYGLVNQICGNMHCYFHFTMFGNCAWGIYTIWLTMLGGHIYTVWLTVLGDIYTVWLTVLGGLFI